MSDAVTVRDMMKEVAAGKGHLAVHDAHTGEAVTEIRSWSELYDFTVGLARAGELERDWSVLYIGPLSNIERTQ